jgi:hypothetical protein
MEAFMWHHAPQTTLMRELLPQRGELRSMHVSALRLVDLPSDVVNG